MTGKILHNITFGSGVILGEMSVHLTVLTYSLGNHDKQMGLYPSYMPFLVKPRVEPLRGNSFNLKSHPT